MAVIYRSCMPEDIEKVLELWKVCGPRGSTNNATALATRLKRDRDLFLLALDRDMLVGSVIGGWDGWRANMYRLAVRPEYRRRGIASELVRRVELKLRRLGAVRVYALAVIDSPDAAPFWNALAYEPNRGFTPLVKTLERFEG